MNTICLDVNESQIKQSLSPTMVASKQLLYNYGFTDEELTSELGVNLETGSMITAMLITQIERNIENNHFGNLSFKGDAWDCLAVAVGVKGIYDLIQNTGSLATFGEVTTRRQMLRLVGKLGGRFLGWIGVALLVRDFGDCMEYW